MHSRHLFIIFVLIVALAAFTFTGCSRCGEPSDGVKNKSLVQKQERAENVESVKSASRQPATRMKVADKKPLNPQRVGKIRKMLKVKPKGEIRDNKKIAKKRPGPGQAMPFKQNATPGSAVSVGQEAIVIYPGKLQTKRQPIFNVWKSVKPRVRACSAKPGERVKILDAVEIGGTRYYRVKTSSCAGLMRDKYLGATTLKKASDAR